MVAAHLRGLLRHNHRFGTRSAVSEDIILEAIAAEEMAVSMDRGVAVDMALIPILNEKGVRKTLGTVGSRLQRAAELRLLDIYKVAEQLAGKLKLQNKDGEISLFQLYQIAEKTGIFDAFDEHYTEDKARPLL